MDGRVALLTGAGRGIGLAMARALAFAGCAVAIQDLEQDVAQSEAGRINSEGGKAIALGGDITDLTLADRIVPETLDRLGGLHILVNNAAVQKSQPWADWTPQEIEFQVRGDFVAPILFCKAVGPIFRRQRFGRIINLGSIQQKNGNPRMLPYSMCKSAIETLTKALARDLAPDNITVNCIAPGFFDTWRNRHHLQTPHDKEAAAQRLVPAGRIGEPHDCSGITLLLCSEAGSYITGQTIYVDGGMSVR